MDAVRYLTNLGYSELQIACLRYTLKHSREDGFEVEMFDGNKHHAEICHNKGITSWAPDENPCSSARQYSAVMRSIANKARKDKEPTLYYTSASPEERKSLKQMGYPSRCWETWHIDHEIAKDLLK